MRQGPGVTSGLGGIGVISVGPSLGVDPPRKMRLRISNKQTNKSMMMHHLTLYNLKMTSNSPAVKGHFLAKSFTFR